jgi:putative resolvase
MIQNATGKLIPERTAGNQRRYRLSQINPALVRNAEADRKTIAYARISSHDQKADLERQKQVLELYCATQGWTFDLISDLGSGMNYHKKGLKQLLERILEGKVSRLVITHKDRLPDRLAHSEVRFDKQVSEHKILNNYFMLNNKYYLGET